MRRGTWKGAGGLTTVTSELTSSRKGTATGLRFSGPFFQRDPRASFQANRLLFMERMAEIGEAEVRRRIAGAPRRTPGPSYSGMFIRGRVKAADSGKRWRATAVISAYGGIVEAGLSKADAIQVQAALAGRKKATTRAIAVRAANGHRAYIRTGNLGTTKGHEGTAHVFARTRAGLRMAMKANARILLRGLI